MDGTFPESAVYRAGLMVLTSPAFRSHDQKLAELPDPNFGSLFQTTFSWAAAWIALYSFGAATATKLPTRTTWAPSMFLIDFSSIDIGTSFCEVIAPVPRGLTQRACHMPGMRTFWMYVYLPSTFAGMSIRWWTVPTRL